jgi:pilin isopeptide linkage protein
VKSTEYKPDTVDDDHKTNKDTAKYTNPYKPAPTNYQPKVEKFITVDYGPIVAEKIFTFELKLTNEDVQGNPDIPGTNFPTTGEQVSVTIPAGETTASAVFSNIRFDKAGTFTFTVTELTSGEEGITDDTVVWTLTVKVVDDDGALRVESTEYVPATEDDEHATNADKATFTNPYKPEPVDAEIVGQKVIDGETQEDMEFTFTLVPVSMTIPVEAEATLTEIPMPAVDTVTVSGAAPFTFGLINYEVAGVYTYKVFEKVDDYVGYTFDDSIYDVTVTITDMDGYLDQKVEYALDGKAAKLALFTNLFETASLTVTKTVTTVVVNGDTLYEFTVELFDENGDPLYGVYPITGSVKGNVVNGKATFSLAHNQNAVISDIPIGASYKVTEKLDEETYTTTFVNPDGTIEREGNISNWYNKPKSVVPNLGGLWINVGDCFE